MRLYRRVSLLLPLVLSTPGIVDPSAAGTLVFPRLLRTAQSAAAGDAASSLTGLNALGVNPAGLHSGQTELLSQYRPLPLQTSAALAGASHPLARWRATLGVSYFGLFSSGFEGRDASGAATGQFDTREEMFGFHASRAFASGLRLGASMNWLRMQYRQSSRSAWSADAGAQYSLRNRPIELGLAARNFGPAGADHASRLPTDLVLSASSRWTKALELSLNWSHGLSGRRDELSLGTQLRLGGAVAVRGRFSQHAASIAPSVAAGVGLRLFRNHTLDYAYQGLGAEADRQAEAGAHWMTLTFRFQGGAK